MIRLDAGRNFEQALEDLEGFERIWILSWFDRNTGWKPKVLPPRSSSKKGVFATRSPHRPNPIGLSLCRLIAVRGRTLRVADPDLLDGTPVLDIKPYIPGVEAFPDASTGWLAHAVQTPYEIRTLARARQQEHWLSRRGIAALLDRAREVLSFDPHPHVYRRTRRHPEGGFSLAIKSWRVRYDIARRVVTIRSIESGYSGGALRRRAVHREFHARWGSSGTGGKG